MRCYKKKIPLLILLIIVAAINTDLGYCEQPLVFVSAPDIHNVESFLQEPPPTELPSFDLLLAKIASFNPSFVLLPGDLGGQRWWQKKYQAICAAPGITLNEVIMSCASKTYPRLISYMAKHSLPSVFVAVGDHEIGDNNWNPGIRANAVPHFKNAFAKYFTKNTDGSSKFNGGIGDAPLRPIGTPYANTAYAVQIANILLVVVDEFRQDNPTLLLGRRGTVKATVDIDGQLQWLDKLLTNAKHLPNIKHIIVAGHLPVLSPVRGYRSSMMYLEGQGGSAFWKLLQKHQVDVYLSGEVHQTTVIKDLSSHIIQISHKGGSNEGFLLARIYNDRIEFELQKLQINADGSKAFFKEGVFVIDKSQGNFSYWASGNLLKPIDRHGLVVHYSFDEDISNVVKNHGAFGASHDGTQHNVSPLIGVLNNAVWFSDTFKSNITSQGITPVSDQQSRTISAWIRTASKSSGAYIYPSGQFWGTSINKTNGFRLLMSKGILKLQIDDRNQLQANQGVIRLNDYNWHHVAVTFNRSWTTRTDEILFYIDGQKYGITNTIASTIMTEINSDTLLIGGRRTDQLLQGWTGSMDDFAIWASALTPEMVKAIKTCAQILKYNASDMESLFRLYRKQSGNTSLKGLNWKYSTQQSGITGVCTKELNNTYKLKLDASGRGVVS